jgi:hypothetical protein
MATPEEIITPRTTPTEPTGTPVSVREAQALGFSSPEGITKRDGMYYFSESLAPNRGGFAPVGVAGAGQYQMTPYYGDVTGSYMLSQEQWASVYDPKNPRGTSEALLRIMRQNEIDALVKSGMSIEEATTKVDGKSDDEIIRSSGITAGGGGCDANGNLTPGGQYNAQGQFVGSSAANYMPGAVGTPEQISARKSAYDLLYEQFSQYGLGSLVEPLKQLVMEGVSPSEFTIRLRETEPYKKRFAANAQRLAKGLSALSEAEYINLEDQYQNIMRAYGLPASYYAKGDLGIQSGFEKLLAGDVSAAELEDRIQTAQNRVFYANPEVTQALRQFYPGISNGDILAYALDPETALPELKRKVTAAEIGAGAIAAGLNTDLQRANELASYGITKEQARQGFQTVAEVAPRGTQLSEFYKQSPYTQATAEAEVFGISGAADAAKQRKKLTALEQASFSGSSGMTGGALARDRAGAF